MYRRVHHHFWLREGSFVPLSQPPPIRALLLPIGGLGWTALLDYQLLPGL
ncbi:hypothetical protein [Methylocystis sp.]|nr:hypothetical protein [Methylocystis sp.]MDP3555471.1 hypothetical protein [Methylocystis sp.]